MKKKITQLYICLDYDTAANYLVLVESKDNIPLATYCVRIPPSYDYHNKNYPYYTINQN
jgi:hypothetical protein